MLMILLKILLCLMLLLYTYLGTVEIPSEVAASFNDLVAHALGYVVLTAVAILAFAPKRFFLKMALACFIYSILIECVQYFLPYRSFSLLDILANGTGVLAGVLLANALWPLVLRILPMPE